MNRIMLVLPLALLLLAGSAAALDTVAVFSGMVYQAGTDPKVGVPGVEVELICDHEGNLNTLGKATSGDDGSFAKIKIMTADSYCMAGDDIYAQATTGQKSQYEVILSANIGGSPISTAPPLFVGVPEFSATTMAVAVIGVTLGIVALRRKD